MGFKQNTLTTERMCAWLYVWCYSTRLAITDG